MSKVILDGKIEISGQEFDAPNGMTNQEYDELKFGLCHSPKGTWILVKPQLTGGRYFMSVLSGQQVNPKDIKEKIVNCWGSEVMW